MLSLFTYQIALFAYFIVTYLYVKFVEVRLFILGINMKPENMRTEIIEAHSQDEAEQIAHDWYISDGWGVYDSKEITD